MSRGVADVQAMIAHLNTNLDTEFRLGVAVAGIPNRMVVISAYPDMDTMVATRAQIAADPDMSRMMAAAAGNAEPGSGVQYVIRHVHGSTERGTGDFVYFRATQLAPGRVAEGMPAAMAIVDHLSEAHGWAMSLGVPMGMNGDTLIYVARFHSANAVDEAFTTMMGDEKYQELAGAALDLVQSTEDRFLMMLPQ
jgi:hypothetical protein